MTDRRAAWLEEHPYLEPLDRLERALEEVALEGVPALPAPSGGPRGEPLLVVGGPFADAAVAEAARLLTRLVRRLATSAELPRAHVDGLRELGLLDDASPEAGRSAVRSLLALDAPAPAPLLYTLGWMALSRVLAVIGDLFVAGDGGTLRRDCPACGAAPGLAQLTPSGDGARRLLACGRCRTRWSYRRIGCPFCGNEGPEGLRGEEVEGDGRLRLDLCERCHGHLKTYTGVGEETVFLLDWTTLHLDALARERGFGHRGPALFAL